MTRMTGGQDSKTVDGEPRAEADRDLRCDHPVREYIADMSRQLAGMARDEGDEGLVALLEAAQARALRAGAERPAAGS